MAKQQPTKKYTTTEAAQITGINENTIRSWMSRYPGKFVENLHFVIEDDGRKLWTETGIEFLKTRPIGATNDRNEPDLTIDSLLDEAANYYAHRFFEELPSRVIRRIQQMRTNPTEHEKALIETSVKNALAIGTFELLPTYVRLPDGEA